MPRRRIVSEPTETTAEPEGKTLMEVFAAEAAEAETPEPEPVAAGERAGAPTLPVAWASLVDDIRRLDVWATYERLRDQLTFGDRLVMEYSVLVRALDQADHNFHLAVKLHRAARLEEDRFGRVVEEQLAGLRSAARVELDAEKADGRRSKAPTIQDVADRVAENWPDLAGKLASRKAELHAATETVEGLIDAWKRRSENLRLMASRAADTSHR